MIIRKISFISLLIFIFSIPCEFSFNIGSFGSLTRMIGLISLGLWGISTLFMHRIKPFHPFYLFLFLYIFWNLASLMWTTSNSLSKDKIETFVQLGLLSWIIWDQVQDRAHLRALLQAYIFGAYVSIAGTIQNFILGIESYEYSGGRYAANGFNANDLSILLAIGLPIAWYLIMTSQEQKEIKWIGIVNFLYIAVSLFAIILTGSRTGFICIIVVIGYYLFTIKRQNNAIKKYLIVLLLISIVLILTIIPASTIQRVANTFEDLESGSLSGRESLFKTAGQIIVSHPLLGVGTGAFKKASGTNTLAHNTFLSILSEIGAIGFLFFFIMLLIVVIEIIHQPKLDAYFWLAIFSVWFIGACSVSWEFQKCTWILLNFMIISASINKMNGLYQRSIIFKPKIYLK